MAGGSRTAAREAVTDVRRAVSSRPSVPATTEPAATTSAVTRSCRRRWSTRSAGSSVASSRAGTSTGSGRSSRSRTTEPTTAPTTDGAVSNVSASGLVAAASAPTAPIRHTPTTPTARCRTATAPVASARSSSTARTDAIRTGLSCVPKVVTAHSRSQVGVRSTTLLPTATTGEDSGRTNAAASSAAASAVSDASTPAAAPTSRRCRSIRPPGVLTGPIVPRPAPECRRRRGFVGSFPVARVVVIGAGMGGLAVAARLATLGHQVVVCEQAATWGGKLGTFARDGFGFDTGPSLLTLPAVYRDLFVKTGKPLEDSVELLPVDPVARYRFPAVHGTTSPGWTCPNASRARLRSSAGPDALGPGAGADWDRFLDHAAPSVAGHPGTVPRVAARRWSRPAAAGPLRHVRRAHRRALADAAAAGRAATCATRGCGCSSTATRPTPARTRAGHLRRWPWCRTSSRPSAPGTSAAACAGSGAAVHERALLRGVDGAHRCRRAAVVVVDAGRVVGRAAARRRADGGRRRRLRRRRATPLRRPAAPRRRRRRASPAAPRDAVAVGIRAAARAARPDPRPRAPHRAVPGRLRRRVRRASSAGDARAGRRTRRSTSAPPTTRRCGPTTTTRRGSCSSTRRGTAPARARSTGRARARGVVRRPGARRDGRAAGWTSATGCCGARCARRPTSSATTRVARRRDLRHVVQRCRARRSCGRRTPRRCPGCSSSAAPRTPAAACPSSGCRPRSSPAWSAPPDHPRAP